MLYSVFAFHFSILFLTYDLNEKRASALILNDNDDGGDEFNQVVASWRENEQHSTEIGLELNGNSEHTVYYTYKRDEHWSIAVVDHE